MTRSIRAASLSQRPAAARNRVRWVAGTRTRKAGRFWTKDLLARGVREHGWSVGEHSYGAPVIHRWGVDGRLRIGRYCSIAGNVQVLLGGEHRVDWTSTYPFNIVSPGASRVTGHPSTKGDVTIGNDVWLAQGCVIMSGVTIGDGAVVAGHAVVVKDVPPYAIVGGNPAKVLRFRFSHEQVDGLLRLRWWDWPDEEVLRIAEQLQSVDLDELLGRASSERTRPVTSPTMTRVEEPAVRTTIDLPPAVLPETLRRYVDLAGMNDAQVLEHYEAHGRQEGRLASDAALRENFLELFRNGRSLLEIGPFCQPCFTGPDVRYLDVLDAAALRARAAEIGMDTTACPERIHYTQGLAEAAGAGFDVIFSSHSIEHQPDLIAHLTEASAALAPGGVYAMLVPDHRYCFDHFLPPTSVAEVLEAHAERRTTHAARHVIEHIALTCHNDSGAHWRGDHGDRPDGADGRLQQAYAHVLGSVGTYVDVHAWKLTPHVFHELLTVLHETGMSPLAPLRVYDTAYGRNEFAAVLHRPE